ncbi:unnamed protein product [Prunus armeniaca]|uniref:NPH3 domain-containing protein n=1 Tax=Prunus armeniaca TaxID=36596 RepID=A0A6J5VP03_PRUAR|nr:unnamed protein product [Prunus armeniaca]
MANMLKVAPALVTELEKRVGMQFEQATLADLLIPSYNKKQTDISSPSQQSFPGKHYDDIQRGTGPNAKMRVARLVDSYLTEVSRDRSLTLTKFQVLAEALPDSARICDDGLYRAIDSYLKKLPFLMHERFEYQLKVENKEKLITHKKFAYNGGPMQ